MLAIFRKYLTTSLIAVLATVALVSSTSSPAARTSGVAEKSAALDAVRGADAAAKNSHGEATAATLPGDSGEAAVIDISDAVPINWASDYATCVGMVGGQIAWLIITRQWWAVPPWVWPKVRAACWRFIQS